MSTKIPCLALLLALSTYAVFSQKPEKWGEISPEDLKMMVYPDDSTANAVVLQDRGNLVIDYASGQGFFVRFSQRRRIKVFDQTAFKEGNLLIPYYSSDEWEKIKNLEVQVCGPDGRWSKVQTDNIFTEQLNKDWSAKKVFIPNLKKGSVIEYRYGIETKDFLHLRPWEFQDELPVRYSEIDIQIPLFFEYVFLSNMKKPWDENTTEQTNEALGGPGGTIVKTARRHLAVKNLPALKDEPFVTTMDDYRMRIDFQLKRVAFPGELPEDVFSTWENLAERLGEHDSFGKQYTKLTKFVNIWEAFQKQVAPDDKPEQLASKAHQFVSQHIKWNGEYRMFTEDNLDGVFKKKSGNSAEINLALVALLRKAGVDAYPLLVSTRGHGVPYPEYPFSHQFNSVLAFMPIGDGGKLLDATSHFYPLDLVDEQHINQMGWLMKKAAPNWFELKPQEINEVYVATMKLTEDGTLDGSMMLNLGGHNAADAREQLQSDPKGTFLKNRFTKRFPETMLDSIRFSDVGTLEKPLRAEFHATFANAAQVSGDFIYCAPVADFAFVENPFKALKRQCPVNFPYPIKGQYVLRLSPPPGYQVEELPQPLNLAMPNNSGRITFSCSKLEDGNVQFLLRMNIAQTDFMPEDYDALRQFFDKLVQKTTEQIVFKKV